MRGEITYRSLNDYEIRKMIYDEIRRNQTKGHLIIITNIGELHFLLHCNLTPKTCENFFELAERKYFNGTSFHRLVTDFIIQGGDPTGTGCGGESVFNKPFEDEF